MKIIDLLNEIANGEEVRFEVSDTGDIFSLKKGGNLYNETYEEEVNWYINEDWLNYGVEIIEEKKMPKKVDRTKCVDFADTLEKTLDTLDNLIDYLNSKEE